jgi:hypothetical protein
MKAVNVYQTIELFDKEGDGRSRVEQACFVLATSVEEAIGVIGKDERRELIYVRELCPISQLPGDIYRIELNLGKQAVAA